jgi:hypothetical protein
MNAPRIEVLRREVEGDCIAKEGTREELGCALGHDELPVVALLEKTSMWTCLADTVERITTSLRDISPGRRNDLKLGPA